MSLDLKIAAIIPARMNSERFPGKPLFNIAGIPMVEHVRRRTCLSQVFSDVVVATCDREIAHEVERFGGDVVMTSVDHEAASDRVAEAMQQLDCSHVVNVQGDEILVLPQDLQAMTKVIKGHPDLLAWNAVSRIESEDDLSNQSIVKCVVSKNNRILFCSRNFDFLGVKPDASDPVRKVLGILAYSHSFLERYNRMERTPIEMLQSIDQSRIIENDVHLQAVNWPRGYPGVNYSDEIEIVERFLKEDPLQQFVLSKTLETK